MTCCSSTKNKHNVVKMDATVISHEKCGQQMPAMMEAKNKVKSNALYQINN